MTVNGAIQAIDELVGSIVVIEGYIGHECDWLKIHRGSYEETWIASDPFDDKNRLKIKLLPSKAYPRPFRFHEMVHCSRTGGAMSEVTEAEHVRFCGRLERSESQAYAASLDDLQWCELPFLQSEYRVDQGGVRSKVAEHEFKWRFAVAPDAPKPEPGVGLAEFLRDRSNIPEERVRVSGVAIIKSNITPDSAGIHILTPTLADEGTHSLCARIELPPVPGHLGAILMNVDLEDRMHDFRVFKCIVEGSYQPEQGAHWVGKFYNLRELVVVDELAFERHPGDVGDNVRGYLFFPNQLLS